MIFDLILTQYGTQMSLEGLQNGLLDLLDALAQKLFAGGAKQLVGLMMKIINIHHLCACVRECVSVGV